MTRAWPCLLGVLIVAQAAAEPPRIIIKARPVPAGENLVANPSFEDGAGEWPDGWAFTVNQPTKVVRFWADEACTGERSAGVRSEAGNASGYWAQDVAVQADTDYLLTARVQIEAGKVLLRAYGRNAGGEFLKSFDRRAYDQRRGTHIMAPVFWEPAWIIDMVREPWAPVNLLLRTDPDVATIQVHIGSYFEPGTMYIDDVYLGPATLTLDYVVEAEGIACVRVYDRAGALLVQHGRTQLPLVAGSLEGLPPDGRYRFEATSQAGDVTEVWYPEPPEGVQP